MLSPLIRLLKVPYKDTLFKERGFYQGEGSKQQYLESVGKYFLHGYHSSLAGNDSELVKCLDNQPISMRGFAFEGAAMGLAIVDFFSLLKRNSLQKFIHQKGNTHIYMLHVGVGWAYARLPLNLEKTIQKFDPLFRWLIVDGYGFHQAYFKTESFIKNKKRPKDLSPFAEKVFFQGVGRCLWFIECAEPQFIANRISEFPKEFHADLWAGIGLACTYAGGVTSQEIHQIKELASQYRLHLAQGAAFAVKTRVRAGNLVEHTKLACQIICNRSPKNAAQVTDDALALIDYQAEIQPYQQWRNNIREILND